jgi:hypothetical protein
MAGEEGSFLTSLWLMLPPPVRRDSFTALVAAGLMLLALVGALSLCGSVARWLFGTGEIADGVKHMNRRLAMIHDSTEHGHLQTREGLETVSAQISKLESRLSARLDDLSDSLLMEPTSRMSSRSARVVHPPARSGVEDSYAGGWGDYAFPNE